MFKMKSSNGWVCPKCERVFGPDVEECEYCNEDLDNVEEREGRDDYMGIEYYCEGCGENFEKNDWCEDCEKCYNCCECDENDESDEDDESNEGAEDDGESTDDDEDDESALAGECDGEDDNDNNDDEDAILNNGDYIFNFSLPYGIENPAIQYDYFEVGEIENVEQENEYYKLYSILEEELQILQHLYDDVGERLDQNERLLTINNKKSSKKNKGV